MKQEYHQISSSAPRPFVKWAGGKRQLIPILNQHIPETFDSFFEPFLGGGAMLFNILTKNPNQKCQISDLNSDLILTYVTIQDKVEELISFLKNHSKNYFKNSKSYYYKIRDAEPKSQIEKASRLIFLNRTCFNGLYRVNSKGKFNVPLGRYTNPNIVNEENLRSVSHFLKSKKIVISCRDFSSILKDARKGDFVYFDPPYQPVSSTANFTSYTHRNFTFDDLERLAGLCQKLDYKGCKFMLSNSNSEEVLEIFSKSNWKIFEIEANRTINSDSRKRTGHSELLIKNY
ncbi:MAG: Modification methylase LlaDCHIA [Nitrosopumilales archaeon]|nr:MAG: Modification methylase LlaDCHIA [Nitrosopumilales archaeon]